MSPKGVRPPRAMGCPQAMKDAKGGAPHTQGAYAPECRAVIVGYAALALLLLLLWFLAGRAKRPVPPGDGGGAASAGSPTTKEPRVWAVPPRFARALYALDDIRGLRWLRRRLGWLAFRGWAVAHPCGRTALVAVVGENPAAVARACAFCSLPGGARVARHGEVVIVGVRLSHLVHVKDAERWVRRRLRAFAGAGIAAVETGWGAAGVPAALCKATSAAIVEAALIAERAARPPRRRRNHPAKGVTPASVG